MTGKISYDINQLRYDIFAGALNSGNIILLVIERSSRAL